MAILKEFRPSNNHYTMALGLFRERLTKPQLQYVLLHRGNPIINGALCEWKHKHIGVGVYELWAEKAVEHDRRQRNSELV